MSSARKTRLIAAFVLSAWCGAIFASTLGTDKAFAAGVGKIAAVTKVVLEDLGITEGGEYTGGGGGGEADPWTGCRVYTTSTVSMNNTSNTYVPWDAESWDDDDHWDIGDDEKVFLSGATGGVARVTLHFGWNSHATGQRYVNVKHHDSGGGTKTLDGKVTWRTGTTGTTTNWFSHTIYVTYAAGDYLRFLAWQDSGGTRLLQVNSSVTVEKVR